MNAKRTVKKYRTFGQGGWDIRVKRSSVPHQAVSNAFLPVQAVVPLGTCESDQARCIVYPGDRVEECQMIGRADKPRASNVHSPIPGLVQEIRVIRNAAGDELKAVVIDLGGSFSKLGRKPENFPWRSLSAADIVHILTEKGVLCLGRKPRPIQQVVAEMKKLSSTHIILNCLDVEPYVATEAVAISERHHAMGEALEILFKSSGADGVILVHCREEEAALHGLLLELVGRGIKHQVIPVQNRYPQGFPAQLREVASALEPKTLPAGTVERAPIIDPATLLAVRDAVAGNKPFMERYITVDGDAIKHPRRLKVRIGMKIGDIIEECGGFRGSPERIILDGPMTGTEVSDLDMPVYKTTTAIIALSRQEVMGARRTNCIRCARCIDVCPEGLEPQLMYGLCRETPHSKALAALLGKCTGCGLCGYICPSRLPLVQSFAAAQSPAGQGVE